MPGDEISGALVPDERLNETVALDALFEALLVFLVDASGVVRCELDLFAVDLADLVLPKLGFLGHGYHLVSSRLR